MRPGGGDAITFPIGVHSKNVHGTRASAVVAKSGILSIRTKYFYHNIQDVNTFYAQKEHEIIYMTLIEFFMDDIKDK